MNIFVAIILLLFALVGIVLRKTYFSIPLIELKRRAERHDAYAQQLYRAATYGDSLRGMLWLYIGLTGAGSLVLLARVLPVWLSMLIIGPILWIVFSLVPATRTTRFGVWVTVRATPLVARLLSYLHPVLSRGADVVERRYVAAKHTGLFERNDLLALIDRQQAQVDSRVSAEELEIAKRALSFSDYAVSSVQTPRKQIKTILAQDTVGPILIDELHQSGQQFVLVRETPKGKLVGTLQVDKLGIDSTGSVSDSMDKRLYYLHENDSLSEALHAFFVTNHALFIVVNSFEEYTGVITVENILRQLLGHVPGDDFDQYADITLVAARHGHTKKAQKASENTEKVLE